MRDEFLFNCEKEIMEANLSLMCGQKEDGLKKNKESFRQHNAGDRKQHTPIYDKHFTIRDRSVKSPGEQTGRENKWRMGKHDQRCRKANEYNRCDTKRRRGTNMQEKLLKTVMAAMEIKKESTEDNVLPALMVEHASIEAARDINNYVTPCSDATAPITVAALRYVADIIEKNLLDVEQAEIAKKTQEALHRSTTVMKEEKKK